ncbi:uncharacterized protein LOC115239193 isoform X2 [Formica exsecta]|uniref:uncharacterized protein LOC115239193 isoform X2 n=1 Tax=Formica exsecta TaxID=72781 RepID=UPI0011425677|nr:uncharacterized protein LOC115239193 isoform X2 [Formica exsecta]
MIALLCMLIVFGLTHGDDLPSRIEVENSINRTINEVERLIRQNSSLPQLTRREIVDILLNVITSKNLKTFENKETIEKARKIYERALMVVLPYNAQDAKENINDLYTKPPIVQIISDTSSNSKDFNVWKNEKIQSSTPTQEIQDDKESLENLVVIHASEKENPPEKTQYKNHRETYSEAHTKMPLTETLKFESAPIKFSFNLDNLQKQPAITETSSTRRPVFKEESSTKNEEVYIVYSTTATTMRPMEMSPKKENVLTTSRPLKYNENVLSVDQWRYNAPTSTIQSLTTSTKALDSSFKISLEDVAPTVISKIENTPEISKIPFKKIQMAKQSTSIYVTPTSSSSSSFEELKYNSTYNSKSGGFHKITTTTTMRPEVMDLLASIGLRPENSTNVEEVFKKNEESLKNKTEIPNSNGFVYKTTSGLTAVEPDLPSISAQNTFENPVLEIGKGMNNLTPDIQLLFQRFGLQTSNLITTTTTTLRPTMNTNSYTNFKPLPTSKIKNEDMKEFLAQFGLGISDNRQKKSMPASTERPSLIEAVPDNMRQILENIGLISRKVSKTKIEDTKNVPKVQDIEPKNTNKFHVFKPHEVQVKDERQRMKINELLDIVNKLIQEGKTSTENVQKAANDLLVNTKTLKDGPDPLHIEEIIRIYNEDLKNEVKRQNSEETVETITVSNEDLTKTTTTTTVPDSAKNGSAFLDTLVSPVPMSSTPTNANLLALEESFGGTTRAPDPVLPTKRRSGLYFLVDWNTFLEVGDEDSEKVNLRFQPKVGDRTRFLPVTIP